MALRIEDYGIIGDGETAALVGNDGSIDWLCWPTFASDTCFASLLGTADNGYWKIAPVWGEDEKPWSVTRRYVDDTLILETTFTRGKDVVRLTDFMPNRSGHSHVARKVECVHGNADLRMEIAVRFDYGRTIPWVTHRESISRYVAGPNMVVLRTPIPVHGEEHRTAGNFSLNAGEHRWFTLSYASSAKPEPHAFDPDAMLEKTHKAWTHWVAKCTPVGPYTDVVRRSLITLKALMYRPTGGVVAAVTTSLPEQIGGPRNWDYRFCWLRDSTFTLLALMNGGFYREAESWQNWLLRSIAGSPDQVQIMYGIAGERQLLEWEVPWLTGYENSRPVRIGNAAAEQLQLDIYGELMDAFFHAVDGFKAPHKDEQNLYKLLIEHLTTIWDQPDQGIWETRSGPQHFTYSKLMVWVALDRVIRLAEEYDVEVPLEAWTALRARVHEEVCTRGYNEEVGAFTQVFDGRELDASLLLLPLVGFLPADDPRIKSTVEAIERELLRDGFVLRYDTKRSDDGLPSGEGAFLACSFWLVSCLKLIGREADARKLFNSLLALQNDVGLLAEEYDVARKRQVGNFPQAFSHISLVNAAFVLEGQGIEMRARHHHTMRPAHAKKNPEHTDASELDPHPATKVTDPPATQSEA